jgi:hypothetical protein
LKVQIEGMSPYILVVSTQAVIEFIRNQPVNIDKQFVPKGQMKMFKKSFASQYTTDKTKLRLRTFSSKLNLNNSSTYIPTIIDCCDSILKEFEPGNFDFQHAMNVLTFNSFCKILFGNDVQQLINQTLPFDIGDGSTKEISMVEYFIKMNIDYLDEYFSPLAAMFPVLSKHGIK